MGKSDTSFRIRRFSHSMAAVKHDNSLPASVLPRKSTYLPLKCPRFWSRNFGKAKSCHRPFGNSSIWLFETCQSHMVCYLIRLAAFQDQSDLHIPKWIKMGCLGITGAPKLYISSSTSKQFLFWGSIPAVRGFTPRNSMFRSSKGYWKNRLSCAFRQFLAYETIAAQLSPLLPKRVLVISHYCWR